MSYNVTFVQKHGYLHAIVTGINSKENITRYLEDIRCECVTRGFRRVLVEERLEGPRLNTTDVFQLASDGSSRARGSFDAIAFVDLNAEGEMLMKFAETVAVNRFLPVKVFSSVSDAERWLFGKDCGTVF